MVLTRNHSSHEGVGAAFAAAFLFGASTPLAKMLSADVQPVLMAGLLYLGSGLGLGCYVLLRTLRRSTLRRESSLSTKDIPWLAGAILAGGIVGPVLLMWGLQRTPASSSSLLLNVEGVLTALLAWFVFRENFDSRIASGMGLITAGALWLSWSGRPVGSLPWGPIAIAGACFAWALDNNLTRKASAGDPLQIAAIKGLVAGGTNCIVAASYGAKLPNTAVLLNVGLIGLFGYGLSLAFFVLALRQLGTARTGAYFSIAPFVGEAISIVFLKEPISPGIVFATILMGSGVWLHLTERHEHQHQHDSFEHEHRHTHDEHHQHDHKPGDPVLKSHSHKHWHRPIIHSHPHYPDIHHRHSH